MKARVYIRIGKSKKGFRVGATTKPSNIPLQKVSDGHPTIFLPTVMFAVDFDIPDELFKQAEHVIAQLDVSARNMKVAAEIKKAN